MVKIRNDSNVRRAYRDSDGKRLVFEPGDSKEVRTFYGNDGFSIVEKKVKRVIEKPMEEI